MTTPWHDLMTEEGHEEEYALHMQEAEALLRQTGRVYPFQEDRTAVLTADIQLAADINVVLGAGVKTYGRTTCTFLTGIHTVVSGSTNVEYDIDIPARYHSLARKVSAELKGSPVAA